MNPYAASFEGPTVLNTSSDVGDAGVPNDSEVDVPPLEMDNGNGQYWFEGENYEEDYQLTEGEGYDPGHDGSFHEEYGVGYDQDNGELVDHQRERAGSGWTELRRVYEEAGAVTALEFDPKEELLWAGHSDGRLTSYLQPDMTKHSSVKAHKHTRQHR
ncbi:unnamed protein product [Choristocarpus tenellus]